MGVVPSPQPQDKFESFWMKFTMKSINIQKKSRILSVKITKIRLLLDQR